MSDAPPPPGHNHPPQVAEADWRPFRMSLAANGRGSADGSYEAQGAPWWLRNVVRTGAGEFVGECAPAASPADGFAEIEAGLVGRAEG